MEAAASTGSFFAAADLEELDRPIPVECHHVWYIFQELDHARGSSGFGPMPISFTEIEAYSRLKKLNLSPEEVTLIRIADDAYFRVYAEMQKKD